MMKGNKSLVKSFFAMADKKLSVMKKWNQWNMCLKFHVNKNRF